MCSHISIRLKSNITETELDIRDILHFPFKLNTKRQIVSKNTDGAFGL